MQVSVVEPSWFEGEIGFEASATMAGHLHGSVLLDPELAHDHVVDAAVDITPGVRFAPPVTSSVRSCSIKGGSKGGRVMA